MDRIQHKIAMEFFRSEIKTLAERLAKNKLAHRHNQRIASKELNEPAKEYDRTGEKYWWCAENAIRNDRSRITALLVVYAEIRGKSHITEEKRKEYVSLIEATRKRMEEYISKKQIAVVQHSGEEPAVSSATGGR